MKTNDKRQTMAINSIDKAIGRGRRVVEERRKKGERKEERERRERR